MAALYGLLRGGLAREGAGSAYREVVEREVAVFRSHEDAAAADRRFYASLTPEGRVRIALSLVASYREASGGAAYRSTSELLESFGAQGVEFVVVGGFAVAFHGYPRFTGDVDLLVRPTPPNAARIMRALATFGFGATGLSEEDLVSPGSVIQLGRSPNRIDLLTSIDGVDFDAAWASRVPGVLGEVELAFIAKDLLLRNKASVRRPQDLADIAHLTEG
jgi:hypothetical protein